MNSGEDKIFICVWLLEYVNNFYDSRMEVQRLERLKTTGHLHDGVIYYYEQNPSGFCFLVRVIAFVI